MPSVRPDTANSPLQAYYYDGKSSRRQLATLTLDRQGLSLRGECGVRRAAFSEVVIGEPLGRAPRSIRFADGAYCEVPDADALTVALAAVGFRENLSVRLHRRWRWALLSLAGVGVSIVVAYVWLLPLAAAAIAPRLPPAFSDHLSEATLSVLDAHLLKPTQLAPARQQAVRAAMSAFAARAGGLPRYRLYFRSAGNLPPNAFALPNGDIVVFDSLIERLDTDETIAVLSHELGHVAYHHGMRQLIQNAAVSTVVAVYLGDVSSLVTGLAATVLESNYSQQFESAADAYGAAALRRAGLSPDLLAAALAKLDPAKRKKSGSRSDSAWLRLFSSHPSTAKRIAALKAM